MLMLPGENVSPTGVIAITNSGSGFDVSTLPVLPVVDLDRRLLYGSNCPPLMGRPSPSDGAVRLIKVVSEAVDTAGEGAFVSQESWK